MDPMTLMAIGMGINGLGSLFGASNQSAVNSQNLQAQQQRYQQLLQMMGGQTQSGVNPYSQQMLNFLGGMRPPGQGGQPPLALNGGRGIMVNSVRPPNAAPTNPGYSDPFLYGDAPPGGSFGGGGGGEGNMFYGAPSNEMIYNPGEETGVGGVPTNNGGTQGGVVQWWQQQQDAANAAGSRNPFPQGFGGAGMPQFPEMSPYNYNPQAAPVVNSNLINMSQLGAVNPQMVSAPAQGATPQASLAAIGQFANYGGASLGATPQIGGPSAFNAPQVDLSAFGGPGQVNAPNLGGVGSLGQPGQVSPLGVGAQQIDLGSIGSSGFNTGQDALMQMLTRQSGGQQDPSLSAELNRFIGGGTGFDSSGLLGAMDQSNQMLLDDQVSQLRGSAGSLGERLGSSMFDAEARLRGQFGAQTSLQREQLLQNAFEQSQGRATQGLGLAAGREQFFAGLPIQNSGLQLSAAQALANSGLGQAEIQARLAQSNAGNALTASQANASNQLQAGLQGQQLGQQAGMFDIGNLINQGQFGAQLGMQSQLANQGAGMDYQRMLASIMQGNQQAGLQSGLQGQQLGTQVGMQNAANQLSNQQLQGQFGQQAGMAGMDAGLQAALQAQQLGSQISMQNANNQLQNMQFGMGQNMQGQLANQNASLQAMLQGQNLGFQGLSQNAGIQNNMGQFNAQNLMQQNQFDASQGNIYNQFMMQGMQSAAGQQNQQQSLNAQLLGILGGVGVPQQQASPWPQAMNDMGMMAMLPWMMR